MIYKTADKKSYKWLLALFIALAAAPAFADSPETPPAPVAPPTNPAPANPPAANPPEANRPEANPPPAQPPEATPPVGHYRSVNTWNGDLTVGTGALFGDTRPHSYMFDARGGAMFIRDSNFYSVNFAYEWAKPEAVTFGVQAEVLMLEKGIWCDVGASLDRHGNPGVMLATGFSLIGVAAEYRAYDGRSALWAVYATLRIPIGVLYYALFTR